MKTPSSLLFGLAALAAAGSLHAAPALVTSASGLAANDSVSWAQLGGDGTVVGPSFNAISAGGTAVAAALAGVNACIAVVGGSQCGWNAGPGFAVGDSTIWTEDNTSAYAASGPLTLSFGGQFGAGLYLQSSTAGAYTASIQAYSGANLLGTFTESSDAAGDAIFIGVRDSVAQITGIRLSVTSCAAGCSIDDFAVNQLLLRSVSAVPEPSPWGLMFGGLTGLGLLMRRRGGRTDECGGAA